MITSAFTFIATAKAIRYIGAIPVSVDIAPTGLNMDISRIEAAISEKTNTIIPLPLHQQKAFADLKPVSLSITGAVSQRCLSLPIFPETSAQQIQTVCDAIR